MDTLTTIAIFVVVIGFLILIHEGGHFLVARWARVWVHEFAVGFGPALLKRKTRETLYALRVFPIGGYVRMAGETVTSAEGRAAQADKANNKAEEKADPAEDEEANVPHERMFSAKSPWARMAIILAGPLTNILGAILIMIAVVATLGAPQIEVRSFTQNNSPAADVLLPGDIILSMNGEAIYSTAQIQTIVANAKTNVIRMEVLRNGNTLATEVTPSHVEESGVYRIGVGFGIAQSNLISQIQSSAFLAEHGVQTGDRVVALDAIPVGSSQTLLQAVEQFGQDALPATISVERGAETLVIDLAFRAEVNAFTMFDGVSFVTPTRPLGLIDSLGAGVNQTWGMAVALYRGIRSIFQGEVAAGEAFSGPVGIANILSDGLRQGWLLFFYLVAFLSLNLGIINMLPFPALDGSRILFIAIELARGKPVPPKYEGWVHQVGFFILLALLVLITFNDIVKLFT